MRNATGNDYLRSLEFEMPDEKTLRKWVLAALRNNTKYARRIFIPALIANPHIARAYLGAYCAKKISKAKQQKKAKRTKNPWPGASAHPALAFDAEAGPKEMFGE
jgi:hypothetical protein